MKLPRLSRRYWIIGALMLSLIFLVSAPANNRISAGSTWASSPDGYRAWYEYMDAKGVSVERWQRPVDELLERAIADTNTAELEESSATLLVVVPSALSSSRYLLIGQLSDWFEAGNQVVMLSGQRSVTAAPFSSQVSSDEGLVTVETRRRLKAEEKVQQDFALLEESEDLPATDTEKDPEENSESTAKRPAEVSVERLLEDEYGAVVWQQAKEQGLLIETTTPFLAANAYADAPGNFAFLAALVERGGGPVYVDEYLHGYKDSDVVVEEVAGTWVDYLAQTPLMLVFAQAGVILLIGLLAQNRRFGLARQIPPAQVNNSTAYIQALAGVLHKANNHDFLVETLTRAEQKFLQRALGLGDTPVSLDALQTAWQQATGRSVSDLNVLRTAPKKGLRSESTLRAWLARLQSLHVLAKKTR